MHDVVHNWTLQRQYSLLKDLFAFFGVAADQVTVEATTVRSQMIDRRVEYWSLEIQSLRHAAGTIVTLNDDRPSPRAACREIIPVG